MGKDVHISGGANASRQFIAAGLVDEITLHVAPALLGAGVRLFEGLGQEALALEQVQASSSSLATHIRYRVVGARARRSGRSS